MQCINTLAVFASKLGFKDDIYPWIHNNGLDITCTVVHDLISDWMLKKLLLTKPAIHAKLDHHWKRKQILLDKIALYGIHTNLFFRIFCSSISFFKSLSNSLDYSPCTFNFSTSKRFLLVNQFFSIFRSLYMKMQTKLETISFCLKYNNLMGELVQFRCIWEKTLPDIIYSESLKEDGN